MAGLTVIAMRCGDPSRTRLVHLRTSHSALSVNDVKFIHVDFEAGKRVVVWQRGKDSDPVVVVANFS